MSEDSDNVIELPDGKAERERQDEERLADHEERRRRLSGETSEVESGGETEEETSS